MNINNHFITITSILAPQPGLQIHPDLQILWQTSGVCCVFCEGSDYVLHTDQICILSPSMPFWVKQQSGNAVLFQIALQYLPQNPLQGRTLCVLATSEENDMALKRLLAQLYWAQADPSDDFMTVNLSLVYALLHRLHVNGFSSAAPSAGHARYHLLNDVCQFLDAQYSQKISLELLADRFFVSKSYLSRYFKAATGMTVMNYLTQLRLNHAVFSLRDSSVSIEEISALCGFPNLHAFTTAFRAHYGKNPAKYRRLPPSPPEDKPADVPLFLLYLSDNTELVTKKEQQNTLQVVSELDARAGVPFRKDFLLYAFAGPAIHLLQRTTQEILEKLLRAVPFRHLYLSSVLCDEMGLYREHHGTPHMDFERLDEICDFVIRCGCLPVLELSFMPRTLAKKFSFIGPMHNYVISMPSSLEIWNSLISQLAMHLISRYGRPLATQFSFSFWHLPDFPVSGYALPEDEMYTLYRESYRSIKSVHPDFKFGLGQMTDTQLEKGDWFTRFCKKCGVDSCLPDFYGWGFYGIERGSTGVLSSGNVPENSINPRALIDNIEKVLQNERKNRWGVRQRYLMAWNASFSASPLNDSIFHAIYLIRNALECRRYEICPFCYCLSDREFTKTGSNGTFSGWNGLFTSSGIPKASFYAYAFLGRLGERLLDSGEGYCVTSSADGYQILLYHYQHFFKSLPETELYLRNQLDYMDYFDGRVALNLQLTLTGLPEEHYRWQEQRLSAASGSAYDHWRAIGSPPTETKEMVDYLICHSLPKVFTQNVTARDGSIKINETLPILSAKLILLTPVR